MSGKDVKMEGVEVLKANTLDARPEQGRPGVRSVQESSLEPAALAGGFPWREGLSLPRAPGLRG